VEETGNVLIMADNQPITRLGAISLWNRTVPDGDIFIARNRTELIHLLPRHPAATVVLDYALFDLSGLDHLFIIAMRFPLARWIIFSDDLSENFLRRIVLERRFSVVMKDAPVEEIVDAFRHSVQQKPYICERIRTLLESRIKKDENERLTATEREILKAIAQGKTSQMIADERSLSIHTIATHRKNIFRKIGVNNVLEASRYAARTGVIDAGEYYI
jgi:DNA-binding NarL/FixJ family response regulator